MLEWLNAANGHQNDYYKPLLRLNWHEVTGGTHLVAKFMWDSDDNADDMSLEDACIVLEHWCKL